MFFYRLLTHILLPFYLLFAFVMVLLGKMRMQSVLQRLGFKLPKNIVVSSIWLHAVSAGEVAAVSGLILYLNREQNIPVVLTTTTVSGFVMAKKRLGKEQLVLCSPFDLPFVVKKFYKKIAPRLLLVMEMELWPELFSQAKKISCPLYLINGRMPLKNCNQYSRLKKTMSRLFDSVFKVFVQSEEDGLRYFAIGADRSKIEVLPNLKYDNYISPKQVTENGAESIFNEFKNRQVIVIGSSHREEESFLIDIINRLKQTPELLVIWAPRDIGRAGKLQRKLKARGYRVTRRSQERFENSQIIVLDSYGELIQAYQIANLVLLGGSWSKKVQGHNPLETAVLGKPIIFGSNMKNFSDIVRDLIICQAAFQSDDLLETVNLIQEIISDSMLQNSMGKAGMNLVKSQQIAVQKYRKYIVEGYLEATK